MLDEPEDRVGDDVVEAVVGLRVGLDHEHVVGAVAELDRDRLALGLARDGDVLIGHRRRDPEPAARGDEAGERRDEPAAAAMDGALAVDPTLELRRTPVGDDY